MSGDKENENENDTIKEVKKEEIAKKGKDKKNAEGVTISSKRFSAGEISSLSSIEENSLLTVSPEKREKKGLRRKKKLDSSRKQKKDNKDKERGARTRDIEEDAQAYEEVPVNGEPKKGNKEKKKSDRKNTPEASPIPISR